MKTELIDQALLALLHGVEGAIVLLATVPPEAFWAVGGLLSAWVVATLWRLARRVVRGVRGWLAARPERARTRGRSGRPTAVRALAARGVSRLEIARATGLSRDVVALLLRATEEGEDERPNLPRTARFAA